MRTITYTYSASDDAWVSEKLTLTGDVVIKIQLSDKGKVVIKKQNGENEPAPKILITKDCKEFLITANGWSKDKIMQIFTSTEPTYMGYANI